MTYLGSRHFCFKTTDYLLPKTAPIRQGGVGGPLTRIELIALIGQYFGLRTVWIKCIGCMNELSETYFIARATSALVFCRGKDIEQIHHKRGSDNVCVNNV